MSLLAFLQVQGVLLALLAALGRLTQRAEVPGPGQRRGARQADRLGLVHAGPHHRRLFSQDDVPRLEAPCGHLVPAI